MLLFNMFVRGASQSKEICTYVTKGFMFPNNEWLSKAQKTHLSFLFCSVLVLLLLLFHFCSDFWLVVAIFSLRLTLTLDCEQLRWGSMSD